MSKGQLARTPENFPRMRVRGQRRKDPIVTYGGGMYCPCGLRITWGKLGRHEYNLLQQELEDHHAYCEIGGSYA